MYLLLIFCSIESGFWSFPLAKCTRWGQSHPLFRGEVTASDLTCFEVHISCHSLSVLQHERISYSYAILRIPRIHGRPGVVHTKFSCLPFYSAHIQTAQPRAEHPSWISQGHTHAFHLLLFTQNHPKLGIVSEEQQHCQWTGESICKSNQSAKSWEKTYRL